jgi:hypothetical protein
LRGLIKLGHVTRMGEMMNAYKFLIPEHKGERPLRRSGVNVIILKSI